MARGRKAQVEGAAHKVKAAKAEESGNSWGEVLNASGPVSSADDLEAIVGHFQKEYPIQWAEIALCPTQHGVEVMITTLRGNG